MAGRFSSWLTLTVAGRGDVSKCDSGGRANRGHVLKVFITPQRARADTLSRSAGHETPTATPRKVSHKLFIFFLKSRSKFAAKMAARIFRCVFDKLVPYSKKQNTKTSETKTFKLLFVGRAAKETGGRALIGWRR